MLSNRLVKHFGAAAAAATVVGAANAAVVTWNVNLAVPNTFYGVYLNIATQTTGGTGGTTPGFDINPYGATSLNFFNGTGATYVRTQASGGPSSLPVGTVIGAASPFFNSLAAVITGTTTNNGWQLNSLNYFGFRFTHDTLGLRYAYGVMQIGANSQERTLLSINWEDSGGSIVVPAPGAMALLGLAGLAGRRRR